MDEPVQMDDPRADPGGMPVGGLNAATAGPGRGGAARHLLRKAVSTGPRVRWRRASADTLHAHNADRA
jgi:hypothetical protein